jgi:hypothetical protein
MQNRVLALVVVSLLVTISAYAQPWQNGATTGDIYYNGGNVGIGTATPGAKLHVFGNASFSSGGVTVLSVVGGTDGVVIVDGAAASTAGIALRKAGSDSIYLMRPASTDDFAILTGVTERLRLTSAGRLGLGTSAPAAQLHVVSSTLVSQLNLSKSGSTGVISTFVGGADSMSIGFDASYASGWYAQHATAAFLSKVAGKLKIQGSGGNTAGTLAQSITELMTIDLATGRVAIGTGSTSYRLEVSTLNDLATFPGTPTTMIVSDQNGISTSNAGSGIGFVAKYTSGGAQTVIGAIGAVKETTIDGNYAGALTFGSRANATSGQSMERMRITSSGNVGIGTKTPIAKLHVAGDVKVDGTLTGATVIGAVYQDVAEWVPASEDMTPGTVVVLDPSVTNQVMPSHRAYDLTVAGVVSAQPGLILGVGSSTKEQIATTGRVKVKVDATRGAIAIGDILVTSDTPGMAMKSQPLDLGGIAIHRPGTVVGKALEPLAAGEGEILVLLSLQ